MKLLVEPTTTALWQGIIHDAEVSCELSLKEEVEAYLVFLMMRYTTKPELVHQAIAPDFLKGMKLVSSERHLLLQEVGDKCLLFSGLFPNNADNRMVKISYFVNVGQSSYSLISKKRDDLYSLLAKEFVGLMDVLQSVRQYSDKYPDLLPLQAYELWNETGSKRAFSILKQYTQAIPISTYIPK